MPEEAQPEESAVETAVETTAPETEDSAAEEDSEQPKKPTETVEFWKAKAREQEKRAKDNDRAAKRLQEIEEAQKSELQKAVERAEAAEGAMGALKAAEQVREWKAEAAKKYGVPADVIRGTDHEDIEEHARELKALLPEPRKPGQVPGEGRTVTTGEGDPATQFAELIKNARRG